jgi:hypothetical protein
MFTCMMVVFILFIFLGNVTLRNFENSVYSCAENGPLNLLIMLRLAKLTHDHKSARKESTR